MQNFSQLKNTIIEECNGLIGTLCQSVHFFDDTFCVHTSAEGMCKQACYSKNLLDQMHDCFSIVHEPCIPDEAKEILVKCALRKSILSIPDMDKGYSDIITSFAEAGILTIDQNQCYDFSSILARRYTSHHYFPDRAISDPSSLRELVVKVIEDMSAISLMSSTVSPKDFPKEATFQHLFMIGLRHTSCNTEICPELSRSPSTQAKVNGNIDFFVDGNLMWGIELVRCTDRIKEHMSRFSPNGKYAGLKLNDYIVLDFCQDGKDKTYKIQDHQATASFTLDAAGCTCYDNVVFRHCNDKPLTLHLKP
jgi:hypothetical protein